jgi:hypothetical protein
MALQEVLTRFGFDFNAGKLAAVERGVKRASTNLNTIAHNADIFQQRMGGFLQRARGLIATYLGFRAVRAITTDYAKGADAVAKFSTALSLNTETYQGLQHAVQLGGSDTENLNKALGQLSKRALEAGQGLKTNQRAFKEAGVDWKDAQGNLKGADVLFLELADGLNNLKDKNKAAGLSMQLMGRTGIKLRNTMQLGSKAIQEQIKEAKALGKVLTQEQLKAAENFNDEMLRAKSVLQGVRNQIAAKLLPAITRQLKAFQMWARRGDNLKVALRRLRIAAKALGAVLAVVITGKVLRGIKLYAGAMQAAVKWVVALGRAAAFAQLKTMALYTALLLIPLLIQDLVFFAQGKDSLIGRILGDSKLAKELKGALLGIGKELKAVWKELKPVLLEAWVALKPALIDLWAAIKPIIGPVIKAALWVITKAVQVLAVAIRAVTWVVKTLIQGFTVLVTGARRAARAIVDAWNTVAFGVRVVWDGIKKVAGDVADFVTSTWTSAATAVGNAWDKTLRVVKSGLDTVITATKEALTLKGLLEDKPITWLEDVRGAVRLQETFAGAINRAATAGMAPLNPFVSMPGGAAPLPPLPGIGSLPGIGGIGGIQATANVAPGAITVNVKAEGDPAAIGAQVNAAVKGALKTTFTDASRDLVKPPPGQR